MVMWSSTAAWRSSPSACSAVHSSRLIRMPDAMEIVARSSAKRCASSAAASAAVYSGDCLGGGLRDGRQRDSQVSFLDEDLREPHQALEEFFGNQVWSFQRIGCRLIMRWANCSGRPAFKKATGTTPKPSHTIHAFSHL